MEQGAKNTDFKRNTFEKSGGGFFPLHKLESAQTRFFVIESLGDCFKSLLKEKKISKSLTF